MPASFVQPSADHPLTVLDIGDSIGQDLGYGLGDVVGTHADVRLIDDSQGDTGLARPDYYNWPANLAAELKALHPQVVVALFGGNDWQPFIADGQQADLGTTPSGASSTGRASNRSSRRWPPPGRTCSGSDCR